MGVLATYENALGLSKKMVELAHEQAWDMLPQTEAERRSLLDSLPNSGLRMLPRAEQALAAGLIRQIQNCDQEVRDYVLPWQESVGKLLARLETKV